MARKGSGPYRTPTPKPSWADRLQDHGKRVTKEKRTQRIAAKPRPSVQEVIITVRGASGNDPGEIAVGYFTVQDGFVTLTNQGGEPIKDMEPERAGNADPKYIAGLLLRKRRSEKNEDFNRRLDYRPLGWR
jgi:hypothetical protein